MLDRMVHNLSAGVDRLVLNRLVHTWAAGVDRLVRGLLAGEGEVAGLIDGLVSGEALVRLLVPTLPGEARLLVPLVLSIYVFWKSQGVSWPRSLSFRSTLAVRKGRTD